MLVLSRRVDECINIYGTVDGRRELVATLMLCDIDCEKGTSKIGVDAPKKFEVFREEIDPHLNDKQMGRRPRSR